MAAEIGPNVGRVHENPAGGRCGFTEGIDGHDPTAPMCAIPARVHVLVEQSPAVFITLQTCSAHAQIALRVPGVTDHHRFEYACLHGPTEWMRSSGMTPGYCIEKRDDVILDEALELTDRDLRDLAAILNPEGSHHD